MMPSNKQGQLKETKVSKETKISKETKVPKETKVSEFEAIIGSK